MKKQDVLNLLNSELLGAVQYGVYDKIFNAVSSIELEPGKTSAVSDVLSVGEELQSWVSVQSFAVQCEEGKYPFGKPVVDANEIAEMIEQLTGAKS